LQEDVYSVNIPTPTQAYTIPIIHAKVLIYLIIIYDNKMYQANQIETANRQLFDSLMSQSCAALCGMMRHTMSSNTA